MISQLLILPREKSRHRSSGLLIVLAVTYLFQLSGCATYVGDNLIRTVDLVAGGYDDQAISKIKDDVTSLINRLSLPSDIQERLKSVSPEKMIYWDSNGPLYKADNRLIVVTSNAELLEVSNSIILSKRSISLSYSSNNIIISMEDVAIGIDGGKRMSAKGEIRQLPGSLVVAKGKAKGTGIRNTQIFAGRGVKCSSGCGNIKIYSQNDNKNLWADLGV